MKSRKRLAQAVMLTMIVSIIFGLFATRANRTAKRNEDTAMLIFQQGYLAKFSGDDDFWMAGSNLDFASNSRFTWWMRGKIEEIRIPCSIVDSSNVDHVENLQTMVDQGIAFKRVELPIRFLDDQNSQVRKLKQSVELVPIECDTDEQMWIPKSFGRR